MCDIILRQICTGKGSVNVMIVRHFGLSAPTYVARPARRSTCASQPSIHHPPVLFSPRRPLCQKSAELLVHDERDASPWEDPDGVRGEAFVEADEALGGIGPRDAVGY